MLQRFTSIRWLSLRIFTLLLPIALVGLLATSAPCVAQATYYVPLPKASRALAEPPYYVARVVDARPQRASLGVVMRGGAPLLATFQEGVANALQAFFNIYVPARSGAVPLVMRLTGLEIAETPGGLGEAATAGLVADFYAPQPDSSYRLVAHFAQLSERAALDATNQHAANLGNLLMEAAKLGNTPTAWLPNGRRYSHAAVLDPQPMNEEILPVLAPTMRPRAGFYHTLPEFWHNQPSEPGQPEVERHPYLSAEWNGAYEVKPYHPNKNGIRVLATDVWGFCDGENFYIRRGRSFYKLERRGDNFVYFGEIGADAEFQRTLGAQTAAYGLVGGMLLASATAPSGAKRTSFKLTVLTGKSSLSQSSNTIATIVGRPTHLFVYRPRDAKGPAVRIRLAEGQPEKELAAGDFLTFEPTSDQPLRVCLLPATGGPEAYLAVTPTSEAPTYLECRPADPEPLRKVKDAAGAAALNKLVK